MKMVMNMELKNTRMKEELKYTGNGGGAKEYETEHGAEEYENEG